MSTLANASASVTPILRSLYEHTRKGRSVLHDVIDSPITSVTLRPAGPRAGTMELLFDSLDSAILAEEMLKSGQLLSWTDSDRPALSMPTFVPTDPISVRLDEFRQRALVQFGFVEVST